MNLRQENFVLLTLTYEDVPVACGSVMKHLSSVRQTSANTTEEASAGATTTTVTATADVKEGEEAANSSAAVGRNNCDWVVSIAVPRRGRLWRALFSSALPKWRALWEQMVGSTVCEIGQQF